MTAYLVSSFKLFNLVLYCENKMKWAYLDIATNVEIEIIVKSVFTFND